MNWVPFAVFGAVTLPLFLVLLGSVGRKTPGPDAQGAGTETALPAAGATAPGDLGPLCREYSAAGYGQVDVVVSLAGLGICVGIGVYLATEAGGLQPLYAGLLVLAGIGLLLYLRHGIRNVRRRVRLYTDGFAYQDGNQVFPARWEDVRSLRGMEPITVNGRTVCPPGSLNVRLRNGQRFTLPFSVKGLEEVAAVLYERCGDNLFR
jgi:hypothetical protein